MSEVLIGDEAGGLTFSNVGRDPNTQEVWSVDVLLRANALAAQHGVWSHYALAFDDLVAFFADMSADWRGWEGERTYGSLEGDLALTATHLGSRIKINAELRSNTDEWQAQATFAIDAGEQLSSAARDIGKLLARHPG